MTGSTEVTELAYGPEGSCWSADSKAAEGCTQACERVLNTLKTTHPEVAECQ